MNLPFDIYPDLERVPWFSGIERANLSTFDFPVVRAADRSSAEASYWSAEWEEIKTEAQGNLTGYLAKNHYESYGGYWNKLAKQSRELIETAVSARLAAAIRDARFPVASMLQPIVVDINRAALEISYRHRFPKAPAFFENLLKVYQAGHLPCGWIGETCQLPSGTLVVL